jgi:2'-5' RNA ligase
VDGQAVPQANFHVTLAFLGLVPGRRFVDLVAVGGQGDYPMLDLGFDRVAYWPRPKVVVAMPDLVPAAGAEMVDRLWGRIVPLGFEREQRPWRPHLTLVRRVRRLPPDGPALRIGRIPAAAEPAPWGLALVESVTHPDGPHYQPLAEWPLG